MKDKITFYRRIISLANAFLLIAFLLLLIHITAPLFGGKILVSAIVFYSIWIALAFALSLIGKKRLADIA